MSRTRQSWIGKNLGWGLISTLCLIFSFSITVFAQSDNAQISGFVKDAAGAVVAGAKVVVKSALACSCSPASPAMPALP